MGDSLHSFISLELPMKTISIIIPVFHNAKSLPDLAERLRKLSQKVCDYRFEFIYVDDGSGDDSFAVLTEIGKKDSRITIVKLTRNFGSNIAIQAGLAQSLGDCAGFVAADLQDPPEIMEDMIREWETGSKVVFAVRKNRHGDPWTTRLFARFFNVLFKKVVFSRFFDQGIGFFLVDRQVVDFLVKCDEKNVHLFGLILWGGFEPSIVTYDRLEREYGRSRWTFGKKIKYFIDAFAAFSYLPLRACLIAGICIAGLSAFYALVVVISKISGRLQVPGWSALMVVILFVSGIQLIMLGVIGEYLWRNFDATRRRPTWVVDRIISKQKSPKREKRNKG
jgi:glycosyltransferase involved in cell wall biosynthesis